MGAYESQLAIRKTPGMTVQLPPGVNSETRTVPQGTYVILGPISILPKQSMVMSLEGLPSPPAWRWWLSHIVGVLVVGVMLAGIFFALARKPSGGATASTAAAAATAAKAARRQKLLDELVELERTGGDPKRREQLLDDIEQLWT
jgi:hypothetical protein